MCGLFYSTTSVVESDFQELAARGPDSQNSLVNDLGFFYHSRLATQPNEITHPLVNPHGVCLYNGTQFDLIQNDCVYIIDNLSADIKQCLDFLASLKGDFALVWVTAEYVLIARDFGGNKPLYFGFNQLKFCASSTKKQIQAQGLDAMLLDANHAMIFSRRTPIQRIYCADIQQFNFDQTINNFDKVFENFETAVLQRFCPGTVVPLSGGMDSGAIAACLISNNHSAMYATRLGHEDRTLLTKRFALLNSDPYVFNDVSIDTLRQCSRLPIDDPGSQCVQVAWQIAKHAQSHHCKFVLSGTGGDEIYSDYGHDGIKLRSHSQFGGKFSKNLADQWPWMHAPQLPLKYCVVMEDYVYGQFGMDTRNPYLDVKLIQSWLNTTVRLKNQRYKSWQQLYLKSKNFPFDSDPWAKKCLPVPSDQRKKFHILAS